MSQHADPSGWLNGLDSRGLQDSLGIHISDLTPERVVGTMPVDPRTRQPFGLLHGGASVALAETLGLPWCVFEHRRKKVRRCRGGDQRESHKGQARRFCPWYGDPDSHRALHAGMVHRDRRRGRPPCLRLAVHSRDRAPAGRRVVREERRRQAAPPRHAPSLSDYRALCRSCFVFFSVRSSATVASVDGLLRGFVPTPDAPVLRAACLGSNEPPASSAICCGVR